MKYESFSGPEINDILTWVADRELVSLMVAQSPEANHAPFFIAVVKTDKQVEPKAEYVEPTPEVIAELSRPKRKGGRPKGWKKGEPYV